MILCEKMPMLMDILWRPVASPLHILGGFGVLAALAIFAYIRAWGIQRGKSLALLLMRLAVIFVLALLLMGPSGIPPQSREQAKAQLSILLDTSGSMLTNDCQGSSRIDYALSKWLSPSQRARLAETFDIHLSGFDASVYPLSDAAMGRPGSELAKGRTTRLAECVTKAVLEIPGAARDWSILVLSDGRDSDDSPTGPAALLAKARNCPIHAVCLGGPTLQRDLAVVAVPKQEYMLAKEPGQVFVKVYQVGFNESATTVHLQCGQEHQSQSIQFKGKASVTLDFPVKQEKAGLYEYKVLVDPLSGEQETSNNAQSLFCEVTEQKIKVLILEGEPFWESKFLAQSLRKDSRIELTQITKLSSRKQEAIVTDLRQAQVGLSASNPAEGKSAEMPKTAEQLAAYDVIILGRGIEHFFAAGDGPSQPGSTTNNGASAVEGSPKNSSATSLLSDFISRRGGHVIFSRGQAYDSETPAGRQMGRDLSVIEPVVWGRGLMHNMSLSVTPEGRGSPCFSFAGLSQDAAEVVAHLPGFSVMPVVDREKVATVVLARVAPAGAAQGAGENRGQPALVVMTYGRGKVVAVLGEGLWRWSMLPPDMKLYDNVYDSFWSNIVRWLAMGSDFLPGETISLKLGKTSVRLGDPLLMDVVCKFPPPREATIKLTMVDPAGKSEDLGLARQGPSESRMEARCNPAAPGIYRAILESPGMIPVRQEKKFSVYDIDIERLQTSANPDALRTLSEQSGGLFLTNNLRGPLSADLGEQLARQQASRLVPPQPNYLWDKGFILFTLLVWMGGEWLGRRKAGLL